ncbi:MAG TPA: hypothetical protein VFE10_15770 [Phenylobacterium sp.]|nr:hypothetical protein [Phenylobacterium sp.]
MLQLVEEALEQIAVEVEVDAEGQNKLPAVATADLTQTAFELRLFRIEDADADPTPWRRSQDDCDVFLTLVFKHLKFRGDRVEIGPMDSRNWLTQPPGGFVEPGHYLLVIEQDSAPDPSSEVNHWEVFRLASALRAQYFNQGVRIEIDPPEGHGGP